jgi:hypothetical protein
MSVRGSAADIEAVNLPTGPTLLQMLRRRETVLVVDGRGLSVITCLRAAPSVRERRVLQNTAGKACLLKAAA